MSTASRPDKSPGHVEEEKLLQALLGRGWLSNEEVQEFKHHRARLGRVVQEQDESATAKDGLGRGPGDQGAKETVAQLVKEGYLTSHQGKRALDELSALLDQPIPGYVLLDKLGQGAMGKVYKARQLSMNRLVAIKILSAKLAANPDYLERFRREAHLAAKLNSNHVVQAIDVGAVGPINYFVMEYVEGATVKDALDQGKIYDEREALQIVLQVAHALDHAHRRQLVHRDVKPSNVIITKDGVAKLADLGMARQVDDAALAEAERGSTIGTPYYIAPELIGGMTEVDIRADIYSLGATLHHMVTGQLPFPAATLTEILQAHLHRPLTPPDHLNPRLSAGLGEVVEMMMAKDRKDRYQTPAELIIDLECLLRGEPPRMARQKIELALLEEMAEGEAVSSEAELAVDSAAHWWLPATPWGKALAVAIGISLFLNLLLLTLLLR